MKKIWLVALFLSVLSAEKLWVMGDLDVYDKSGKEKIGKIARGTPVEKVSDVGDKTIIRVKGYLKTGDDKVLYGTKNFVMPFISLSKAGGVKADTMEVSLPKKDLTNDQAKAWADSEFLYYDTCSMCHAAHAPKEHNMMEWDGIFATMRTFAMPTDEEADKIIQYLHSHAIDGYATDDE
ncbi:hypothetical protein [Helicobacter cetorum]|uniref:Periplasmic protein n=1 Tax=Helicobacter cetorum (strain ATCC BAA-540 / CCUG 52418 / MIT 99-5656) TaxID=1163745 RepID=I0ERH2_HELCM|nr:hypothetical protein [Helicobacter cetorum]AFI05541.1 periplasmic protein [Helicobacter cetorum MIT 99-5656]